MPQGSVLGPLLFLIYINDLPSALTSQVHLFADDCVIYREITCTDDTNALQSDLNYISDWCNTWRMELNINKCKILRVHRNSTTLPFYHLNNIPLDSVNSYKYLGVHITSNLTWSLHIEYIIGKANSTLGYLRHNFSNAPSSLKLLLYQSLVHPKLEYAAAVWDPHNENLIFSLELVQNNSVRFIYSNYYRTSSISSMKANLCLPSLASRRYIARLTLFHKLYHHPFLQNDFISQPHYLSHRIDHRFKVRIQTGNTNTFSNSFFPRTSRQWNHLPYDIVAINDNKLFRKAVANIV